MKVAFTHNLRVTDVRESEKEAEYDSVETVHAIAAAIEAAGHEVEKVEVSGPASNLLERLEAIDPDLIFNTAEGVSGPTGANNRLREAVYPALFDELGIPYTGSDGYTNTITLDKWITKLIISRQGIDTPRATLVNARNHDRVVEGGIGLAFPVIVKPNYEGSSKGIYNQPNGGGSVLKEPRDLAAALRSALRAYPEGVLVEEYVEGLDVTVGYIDGVGHDDGLLTPVELMLESTSDRPFNIYDYRLKHLETNGGSKPLFRCPAGVPRDIAARMRGISAEVIRTLGLRDVARLDFRISSDGRIYLLEANALPSLAQSSAMMAAAAQLGLTFNATIAAILNAAALRTGVATASQLGVTRRSGRSQPIRVGFTYNVKRTQQSDDQAEWDPPETIIAIANALARQGHIVVHLEATPDLPRVLAEADVDLIFNIAEGVEGRNREAQVPALCELLGVPYTGSDSATLAIALDKALCKKVLMQHDILTPKFQLMESERERLSKDLQFPLIVKPNAEGSSKGIGSTSVVDTEEELRASVKSIVEKYRQPAIIEEYIAGREFTVGLLGDKRPRVLPPMEIRFKNDGIDRPVYDYGVKQEWEKHVYYECPAKLTEAEQKAIEKIARATFWALDCRDVARVDLRMDAEGRLYVLEVNPLPGLTPDYSDLVLISKAVGMEYDSLIAEIMTGGLRRLRDKRREERENESDRKKDQAQAKDAKDPAEKAAEKAEKAAEKAEKAAEKAKRIAKLAAGEAGKNGLRSMRYANGNGNGNGNGGGGATTGAGDDDAAAPGDVSVH
ncbi:MAG: ATP-grasp domain-containing protein [Kofleriaceae bacterium]|nr:ATP-grasp domain-containing protein [Myxococcales bacterium]MCB9570926.1 ATP-grasp domain-containing protein [Kofleriaceae bacterium]